MAVGHDVNDGYKLLQTPGWQTLMTILRESGENAPLKRAFVEHSPPPPPQMPSPFVNTRGANVGSSGSSSNGGVAGRGRGGDNNYGPLAKRFRGFSLKEEE